MSPPGRILIVSFGRRGCRASVRSPAAQGSHRFSVGVIRIGTPLSSGESEGRSWWQTSRESAGSRDPAGSTVRQSPGAPRAPFFRVGSHKAQEGTGREADPTAFELCSGEALRNPREYRSVRASARVGTDPRGEQSPEAAGHRGLLVLRAEECDVRNSKRATAPKGARLRGGEKL